MKQSNIQYPTVAASYKLDGSQPYWIMTPKYETMTNWELLQLKLIGGREVHKRVGGGGCLVFVFAEGNVVQIL